MASVSRWVVGIFAAWWLGAAPVGATPPERPAAVFVDAFDVEQVPALVPGAALQFSVFASPGASATVLVEGVRRLIELREVSPGVYEGTYVIDAADRVGAASTAVATVWRDGAVARATLEESLVLDGAPPLRAAAPVPAVPPAAASPPPAALPPPSSQEAEEPWRDPRRAAVPPWERGAVPPRMAGVVPPAAAVPPSNGRHAACRDCAVVEAIRVVETPTGPAYAGAIAGGIVGAVFGDKIGKAHEKHVTRVLGALTGAVVGHEIQRSATSRTWYDASLRLPNGTLRVLRYDAPPPYRVGQFVRLEAAVAAGAAPTL